MYKILYTKVAFKHIERLKQSKLAPKAKALIEIIKEDPYKILPPYEKLLGDLEGKCSRRINIHHRLVYEVFEDIKTIKILSMWTHYEAL